MLCKIRKSWSINTDNQHANHFKIDTVFAGQSVKTESDLETVKGDLIIPATLSNKVN